MNPWEAVAREALELVGDQNKLLIAYRLQSSRGVGALLDRIATRKSKLQKLLDVVKEDSK